MLFYDNFKRICEMRGTSPSGAVVSIGKNKTTAGNWKRNNTIPSEEVLVALAKALGCYVSDFFRMPGEPLSGYAEMMEGMPVEPAPVEDGGPGLEEGELDFLELYGACSKRERSELMALVYRFAEDRGISLEGEL